MTSKIPPKLTLGQALELAVSLQLELHQKFKLTAHCPEFFGWHVMQGALKSLPSYQGASAEERIAILRYSQDATKDFVLGLWPGFVEHLLELGMLRRSEEAPKAARAGKSKPARAGKPAPRKTKPAGAGKPTTRPKKTKSVRVGPAGAGGPDIRIELTKPARAGKPKPRGI